MARVDGREIEKKPEGRKIEVRNICLYDFRSQSYIKAWQVMYYVYQGGNHSGETTVMCDDCGKFLLLCRRGNYEQMKNDHVFI